MLYMTIKHTYDASVFGRNGFRFFNVKPLSMPAMALSVLRFMLFFLE